MALGIVETGTLMIKRLPVFAVIVLVVSAAYAAKQPASPARTATGMVDGATITIKYSAPSLRGRSNIFEPGGLISKDKTYPAWRAGANAATALETTKDIQIGDIRVPKGNYTLFVDIKNPDAWVLIVNKQTGQWGLTYNRQMDLGRTKMEMSSPGSPIEMLNYKIENNASHEGTLVLEWGRHIASVPIRVEK